MTTWLEIDSYLPFCIHTIAASKIEGVQFFSLIVNTAKAVQSESNRPKMTNIFHEQKMEMKESDKFQPLGSFVTFVLTQLMKMV